MAGLFVSSFVPAFSALGVVMPGASLTFYESGTSALADVFADSEETIPLTNPVRADVGGRFPAVYMADSTAYRVVLKSAAGVIVGDIDPYGQPGGGLLQPFASAVIRTQQDWFEATIKPRDFAGIKGDGANDDTDGLQRMFDEIADYQIAQIGAEKLTKGVVNFEPASYQLSKAVKVRGFIGIVGAGTAYNGGSVVRQNSAAMNIFEFYGSLYDNRSLSTLIDGMNFEFAYGGTGASGNIGVALYYPMVNDIGGAVLTSTSHYIRNNRFGGWKRNGQFLRMFNCNDVDLSHNVIDVCSGSAMEFGDSANADAQCSDVRISGHDFYYCQSGISLRNVKAVTIGGSNFRAGFDGDGWQGIDMTSGAGPVVQGRIADVSIAGCTFTDLHNAFIIDGSARPITIGANVFSEPQSCLMRTIGNLDVEALSWSGGTVKLKSDFAPSALILSNLCSIKNSSIVDMVVDAHGNTNLVGIIEEHSGPASGFGPGMTLRGPKYVDNGRHPASQFKLLPCDAVDLEIENQQTLTTYPTSLPIYNMDPIVAGDAVSFEVAYTVDVNKPGIDQGRRSGRVRIELMLIKPGGTIKKVITPITSNADDNAGTGTSLPTVTFDVQQSPAQIVCTVTCPITGAFSLSLKTKVHDFFASGTCAIKCA